MDSCNLPALLPPCRSSSLEAQSARHLPCRSAVDKVFADLAIKTADETVVATHQADHFIWLKLDLLFHRRTIDKHDCLIAAAAHTKNCLPRVRVVTDGTRRSLAVTARPQVMSRRASVKEGERRWLLCTLPLLVSAAARPLLFSRPESCVVPCSVHPEPVKGDGDNDSRFVCWPAENLWFDPQIVFVCSTRLELSPAREAHLKVLRTLRSVRISR